MILRKNGAKWVQYSALCFTKCNFGLTKGLGGLYCFAYYQCHSFLSLLLFSMTVNSKNCILNVTYVTCDISSLVIKISWESQFDSTVQKLKLETVLLKVPIWNTSFQRSVPKSTFNVFQIIFYIIYFDEVWHLFGDINSSLPSSFYHQSHGLNSLTTSKILGHRNFNPIIVVGVS